jgi:hypothetical protein
MPPKRPVTPLRNEASFLPVSAITSYKRFKVVTKFVDTHEEGYARPIPVGALIERKRRRNDIRHN